MIEVQYLHNTYYQIILEYFPLYSSLLYLKWKPLNIHQNMGGIHDSR